MIRYIFWKYFLPICSLNYTMSYIKCILIKKTILALYCLCSFSKISWPYLYKNIMKKNKLTTEELTKLLFLWNVNKINKYLTSWKRLWVGEHKLSKSGKTEDCQNRFWKYQNFNELILWTTLIQWIWKYWLNDQNFLENILLKLTKQKIKIINSTYWRN